MLKVLAMIPARIGSTRLKMKNLALINKKPMISYAIKAALESKVFDRVIINSDSNIFSKVADKYGGEFYLRPYHLGSSETKSDDVIYDFIKSHPEADIVVWVNPIAPFQSAKEVANIIKFFIDNNLDSLITTELKQVHCDFNGKPINYSRDELFAQTQDLKPIEAYSYTIMMWRVPSFIEDYQTKGYGLFCGNFGTYPVSKNSGVIIKTSEDFNFANNLMKSLNSKSPDVEYDDIINEI